MNEVLQKYTSELFKAGGFVFWKNDNRLRNLNSLTVTYIILTKACMKNVIWENNIGILENLSLCCIICPV